jgi:hypothetical protein
VRAAPWRLGALVPAKEIFMRSESDEAIDRAAPAKSLTPAQRREASRQARDAFPAMGVWCIRDHATAKVRVAASRNVPGAINRAQFELRRGAHADKALQAQWKASAPERFSFEVIELVKERSDPAFDYAGELQALLDWYREQLEGAAP